MITESPAFALLRRGKETVRQRKAAVEWAKHFSGCRNSTILDVWSANLTLPG